MYPKRVERERSERMKKMSRLEAFESLASHGLLGRVWARLKPEGERFCLEFIEKNDHLGCSEFGALVNRLFLDEAKPKNASIIQEILSCTNSTFRTANKEK